MVMLGILLQDDWEGVSLAGSLPTLPALVCATCGAARHTSEACKCTS